MLAKQLWGFEFKWIIGSSSKLTTELLRYYGNATGCIGHATKETQHVTIFNEFSYDGIWKINIPLDLCNEFLQQKCVKLCIFWALPITFFFTPPSVYFKYFVLHSDLQLLIYYSM
jgi:hypothetical protein